jgi:hypothetical protein
MNSDPASLAREVSPRSRGLFLKNLADFQTELARIQAGFIPGLAIWEQRKSMPALVFRSLRRVQDLRARCKELGLSLQETHFSGSVSGRSLLERLCTAKNSADFCAGAIRVVHRTLVAAINEYLKRNDGVYDLPSVPLLEADRAELEQQIAWAEAALPELAEMGLRPDAEYVAAVEQGCAGLSALLQEYAERGTVAAKGGRRCGNLPLATGSLPRGFFHLEFGPSALPPETVYAQRARYNATNFLQEVQATDSCASMLFEAPDMPWEFYLDLSRHMWDEARHSMFGERKLEELGSSAAQAGLSSKAYDTRQTLAPLDRYAALTTQEADAFPNKHVSLKDALANEDAVSAMAWSYDIADETQHVRFGTKWLPVMIDLTGDPRSYAEVQADGRRWRETVLAEVYNPAATSFRK